MFKIINTGQNPGQETLNTLYEYDDFMLSIRTLVDLGCGKGEDLVWWATRTTRDDICQPLNIRCIGVDQQEQIDIVKKYSNISYQQTDFEGTIQPPKEQFDILWCNDSFQYCIDPISTLSKWWNITSKGGMLVIIVPQTIITQQNQLAYYLPEGAYYHHTMISLIRMLATAGWDCRNGFFLQRPSDNWIQTVVYKSQHEPMDPKSTTWNKLSELELLPESADTSIRAHGYLRQQDLLLPWLDKSLVWMGKQ
jgi:SAM-dependent methyltransferase